MAAITDGCYRGSQPPIGEGERPRRKRLGGNRHVCSGEERARARAWSGCRSCCSLPLCPACLHAARPGLPGPLSTLRDRRGDRLAVGYAPALVVCLLGIVGDFASGFPEYTLA